MSCARNGDSRLFFLFSPFNRKSPPHDYVVTLWCVLFTQKRNHKQLNSNSFLNYPIGFIDFSSQISIEKFFRPFKHFHRLMKISLWLRSALSVNIWLTEKSINEGKADAQQSANWKTLKQVTTTQFTMVRLSWVLPRVARLVRKRDYDYAIARNSNLLEKSALRVQLFVKLFNLVRVVSLNSRQNNKPFFIASTLFRFLQTAPIKR